MQVKDIMQTTREVVHVDENLLDASIRLRRGKLPALAVVDGDEVVGILTEATISEKAASLENDLAGSAARDLMSAKVGFCRGSEDVETARKVMAEEGHSHLLVTDLKGKLCGLLAQSDLPAGARPPAGVSPEAKAHVVETAGRAKGDKPHRPNNYSVTPKLKD